MPARTATHSSTFHGRPHTKAQPTVPWLVRTSTMPAISSVACRPPAACTRCHAPTALATVDARQRSINVPLRDPHQLTLLRTVLWQRVCIP